MIKAREFLQSPIKRDKALPDSDFLAVFNWKILRLPLDFVPMTGCNSGLDKLSDRLILAMCPLDSKLAVLASSAVTGEKN